MGSRHWVQSTGCAMDVSDLKGLFAEVKKRMDGQHRVRAQGAGAASAPGAPPRACWTASRSRPTARKMPLNQVASLSIPEPSLIVAQPFDPSLMARSRARSASSDLGLNPANDGKVIRIPIPRAHRRAPQGAVASRAQDDRGRPQPRPHRPPRRQRQAEEDAQGAPDLRRRREAGARRSAEDHRRAHQGDRRSAAEEGSGAAWAQ